MARLVLDAEKSFVGGHGTLVDHLVCRLARPGSAMLLDTRSMEFRYVNLPLKGARFLITNSNVPRTLGDSEYNQRRAECDRCVSLLAAKRPGRSLRDYSPSDLRDSMGLIPVTTRKRCLHVVEENQRVLEAEAALRNSSMS